VGQVMRPAGAAYAAGTPLCFASGNHDVRGIHARSLENFLEAPGERRYYILRQGPLVVVVLDTGEDKPDTHSVYAGLGAFARYRREQRRWLEGAVASEAWRSAAFRVAVLHIPLWGDSASEGSRAQWHDVLEGARTDLVINGHVHRYKHTPPDKDHSYTQVVGGGPKASAATVMHAQVDGGRMGLIVRDLEGTELGNFEFKKA
jgi:acid phosphatase type 7